MKKILLLLCLLAPSFAFGEEIKIYLDMSYDTAIELLQKCGAKDVTEHRESSFQLTGLTWLLEDYSLQVSISEHYGKINRLSYQSKNVMVVDRSREETERLARSLTLNPEKKTFFSEDLWAAQKSLTPSERWNVRAEMLMVSLPQEKALSLLPDLRDAAKIESAYAQIMEAIQRKEVKLIAYPAVTTLSGQTGTAETIFEKLYPTQFEPPQVPQNFGNSTSVTKTTTTTTATESDDTQRVFKDAMPTNFEKRNLGVTLEVRPVVRNGGRLIEMDVQPNQVELEGFDSYEAAKGPGVIAKIEQPRFFTVKNSASVLMKNGQRLLYGVHQSNQPGQMEFFIFQATATMVED